MAGGIIGFQQDPNPQSSHNADIPWYDDLLGPIPDILMAIVVPIIANGIAGNLQSQMANLPLADLATPAIKWSNLPGIQVQAGGWRTVCICSAR